MRHTRGPLDLHLEVNLPRVELLTLTSTPQSFTQLYMRLVLIELTHYATLSSCE